MLDAGKDTPQLAVLNVPENQWATAADEADGELIEPTKCRGKRTPLSADLRGGEVTHNLPEHEQTCECGCRKHMIARKPASSSNSADVVSYAQTCAQGLQLPWLRKRAAHGQKAIPID